MRYLYVILLMVLIIVVIYFKSWSEDFHVQAEAAMAERLERIENISKEGYE